MAVTSGNSLTDSATFETAKEALLKMGHQCLYKKHGIELSGIRCHGVSMTDDDIHRKRLMADELRSDPEKLQRLQKESTKKLAWIDARL